MADPTFHGSCLRLARVASGLTQSQLAGLVATSGSYISEIERGSKEPGDLIVRALAEALAVEPQFFYTKTAIILKADEINFRRRANASEFLKARVSAKASLFLMTSNYLDEKLGFPPFDVPAITAHNEPEIEAAALECRMHWGFGVDAPMPNMVRVAENAGVVVTEFQEADQIDAFSAFNDSAAVIVLNTSRDSTSRKRWSIAHELGHFCIHRGRSVDASRDEDKEADRFASSLLMPAKSFGREFRMAGGSDWPHLFELKRRWKVSVASIVRRAFDLGLIGAVEYRRRYKYLSARDWRTHEPQEPPYEPPELMGIAVAALQERFGRTTLDIAHHLGISRAWLEEVTGFNVPPPTPENVRSLSLFKARRSGLVEDESEQG